MGRVPCGFYRRSDWEWEGRASTSWRLLGRGGGALAAVFNSLLDTVCLSNFFSVCLLGWICMDGMEHTWISSGIRKSLDREYSTRCWIFLCVLI